MADSKQWKQDAEAKFGGFPVWLFAPADGGGDQAQMGQGDSDSSRAWLLHLPGLFAFGSHSPDACGVLADPPARPPAQVVGELDLTTYVAMFKRLMRGGGPPEFTALGFDALTRIRWRFSFDGTRILDEIEVELADEPKGLVGALLAGKAALPAQPLPAGALAQLRCGVDLPMLLECAQTAGLGQLSPRSACEARAQRLHGRRRDRHLRSRAGRHDPASVSVARHRRREGGPATCSRCWSRDARRRKAPTRTCRARCSSCPVRRLPCSRAGAASAARCTSPSRRCRCARS
jgi:hypothetical protein